jgi:predicted transcriptional regulator
MKNAEKKTLAKTLFVKSSMNRKEIATQVGVTEKTLRNWIDGDNWEELKNSQTITRSQLLQDAYNQLRAINQKIEIDFKGIPTKELSDAKGVIRKEIEHFSHQPIYKYVEVFEEFIEYTSKISPSDLNKFSELSQGFIAHISKRK